jgi:hypothetical protein
MAANTDLTYEASPFAGEQSPADMAMHLASPDAKEFCRQHLDEMYHFWVALLRSKSAIAKLEPDWQDRVSNVFRYIDSYIARKQGNPRLQRMGYIGLVILMEDVKRAIALHRRCGGVTCRRGQRNASLALDLYLAAVGSASDRLRAKRQIHRQLETGRRWQSISLYCPMLSVLCIEKADQVV